MCVCVRERERERNAIGALVVYYAGKSLDRYPRVVLWFSIKEKVWF